MAISLQRLTIYLYSAHRAVIFAIAQRSCSELYLVCVFSCTVLFVSISKVIGVEDLRQNDLDCVGLNVKLYSNSKIL